MLAFTSNVNFSSVSIFLNKLGVLQFCIDVLDVFLNFLQITYILVIVCVYIYIYVHVCVTHEKSSITTPRLCHS